AWAGPREGSVLAIGIPKIRFTYADHEHREISQRELLAGVPEGHHSTIMRNVLSAPKRGRSTRGPSGKYSPPAWLFPSYGLARVSRSDPEHMRSLAQWLRDRARTFYAGAEPIDCEVTWFTEKYRTNGAGAGAALIGRTRTSRLEVSLEVPHSN